MATTVCLPLDISKAAIVVDNVLVGGGDAAISTLVHSERWSPLPLCLHKCSKKVFPPKKEEYIFFTRSSRPSSPSFCPKQFRLQLLDCRPVEWGIRAAGMAHPRLRLAPDEMRGPSFLVNRAISPVRTVAAHLPISLSRRMEPRPLISANKPAQFAQCYFHAAVGDQVHFRSLAIPSHDRALEVGVEGKGGETHLRRW